MNYIESLLSELIHCVQDESLDSDIPPYAARIVAVVRNLAWLNDSRLSELLQALEDCVTALISSLIGSSSSSAAAYITNKPGIIA